MSDRPLRVLHLGNIANNAYNNAKLLRAAGVDCDVLCPLYYHSMACPEWEDADFSGALDEYRPAWHTVDLGGFVRPDWFAQGPPVWTVRYLLARRRGQRLRTAWYRMLLQANLRLRAGWPGQAVDLARRLAAERPSTLRHMSRVPPGRLARHGMASLARAFVHLGHSATVLAVAVANAILPSRGRPDDDGGGDRTGDAELQGWVRCFHERFGERIDQLRVEDLEPLLEDASLYGELFAEYDVVQAYATDPIYPLLAGHRPFVAFEHGTLREIPWEATPRGRCTTLSYSWADHVLVSNPDCRPTAEALNPGNVTVINHPWDEDHALGVEGVKALRSELLDRLDAQHLVFFPTRHDWVRGTGYADKANDRFFRALARWMADTGDRVGVVCCEWGRNVEDSRALVEAVGLSSHVEWSPPMGTVRFERFVLASDLVADQFEVPGMGGIAFKALSAGRPVLMRIDEEVMRTKYGEVPPVFDCHEEGDIQRALDMLREPRDAWQERCDAARNWIKKHHAAEEVVTKQLAVYERLSEARPASEPLP